MDVYTIKSIFPFNELFIFFTIKSIFILMNWFLYDKDIRHERIKPLFTHHTPKVCSQMS